MPASLLPQSLTPWRRHLATALALGLLTACATGADAPAPAAAAPAEVVPLPVAPVLAASAPAAPPAVEAPPSLEPTIIRGNDKLLAPGRPASAITGPASAYKFEDAPSTEVVHVMLRDILKVDYVIYPPLPGTITLATRNAISADRALSLLENALQVNGIVMARDSRGTYHVGRPEALRGIVAAPRLANGPLAPGYGAVIIPLQYLGASEMAAILRPMAAADAIVRVDTVRNILVMQGTRAQAEGWMDIVNTFDVNLLRGMSVGVFPLKYATAREAEAALRMLSGAAGAAAGAGAPQAPTAPGAGGRSAAAAAQAQAQAQAQALAGQSAQASLSNVIGEGNPLHGALRIMPIERINALLVVTPRAAYLDEVRYWIEQFDRPGNDGAQPQLFVYKVQNGSADHLAELLNGIYGGTTTTTAGTGATGVAPGAVPLTSTSSNFGNRGGLGNQNMLGRTQLGSGGNAFGSGFGGGGMFGGGLGAAASGSGGLGGASMGTGFTGQNAGQAGPAVTSVTLGQSVRVMADRINNTLLVHATAGEYERIDATLKRLDVPRAQILIEASIVEVTLGDGLEYGLQWAFRDGGLGGGRSGSGVLSNAASGAIAAAGQGFTYTLSNAAGNISAVLRTLASQSLVKMVSSPSLMVLDNHTASITVGNQQPIRSGDTITTGGVVVSNNIQYKDTGVLLSVRPSVNAGDLVTLDIDQAVIDVGLTPDDATGQSPFMQRQVSSKVAVRSGETMVLGGLIKDNTRSGKSGLPILSSIPIVGALFGRHENTADRTELLVILTPRVVRSDEDVRAISRELRERMRGLTSDDARNAPTR